MQLKQQRVFLQPAPDAKWLSVARHRRTVVYGKYWIFRNLRASDILCNITARFVASRAQYLVSNIRLSALDLSTGPAVPNSQARLRDLIVAYSPPKRAAQARVRICATWYPSEIPTASFNTHVPVMMPKAKAP